MFGSWREKLSILICEYFLDGFEGTRQFESDGFSEKVYLFDADYTMGLTTEWKHIMLNYRLFDQNLKKAQRQIFLHEKAHASSSTLLIFLEFFAILFLYIAVPLIGLLIFYVLAIPASFNTTILGLSSTKAVSYLYILIPFIPIAIIISYVLETKADCFSLRYMDSEEFMEAKESFKEVQPLTPTRIFSIRLTHPSPEFVLKSCEILKDY